MTPEFNIVGEEWNTNPAAVAFWQKGKINPNGYISYLKSLMDFPLQDAIIKSMTWNSGLNPLYETLALDYLYPKSDDLVIFAENHDTERFFRLLVKIFPNIKRP